MNAGALGAPREDTGFSAHSFLPWVADFTVPWAEAAHATPAPVQVATVEDGSNTSKKLLAEVHASLMSFHQETLKAKGINPAALAPPKAVRATR